jgi:hypothetical protein
LPLLGGDQASFSIEGTYDGPYVRRVDNDPNLNWSFKTPERQLQVVAGTAFGTEVDEALVKLREFKNFEASFSAKEMELGPEDVVAEIGSGYGYWATATSPLVRKVMCLDISPDLLDLCRQEVSGKENIECHQIAPGDLSVLASTGVNKIYSAGVFIHFNLYDVVMRHPVQLRPVAARGEVVRRKQDAVVPADVLQLSVHRDQDRGEHRVRVQERPRTGHAVRLVSVRKASPATVREAAAARRDALAAGRQAFASPSAG